MTPVFTPVATQTGNVYGLTTPLVTGYQLKERQAIVAELAAKIEAVPASSEDYLVQFVR